MGPLHNEGGIRIYREGLDTIRSQGGNVLYGGNVLTDREGYYVEPTIVEIDPKAEIVKEELFVPILYLFKFTDLDEAIQMNNSVP